MEFTFFNGGQQHKVENWLSDWLLVNANVRWWICQWYHGENKVCFWWDDEVVHLEIDQPSGCGL